MDPHQGWPHKPAVQILEKAVFFRQIRFDQIDENMVDSIVARDNGKSVTDHLVAAKYFATKNRTAVRRIDALMRSNNISGAVRELN